MKLNLTILVSESRMAMTYISVEAKKLFHSFHAQRGISAIGMNLGGGASLMARMCIVLYSKLIF